MPEWDAEVTVDVHLARRLITAQFPQLELDSLHLLAEGWDNSVWVANDRWAFRFPRRAIAIPGVKREMAVLPPLATLLPLPIPTPRFHGRPADIYPWPFFGAPLLPGRELSDAALTDSHRAALARPLATFLRRLHSRDVAASVSAECELPADPMRRGDMAFRVPATTERLAEVEQLGLWRPPRSLRHVLEAAQELHTPEPSAVVHGDLHFRHVLVDRTAAITGIIDWGDVCLGDPSIDLPLLWCFLPPDSRSTFLTAYGPTSVDQLLRARTLALFLCAALAVHAHHHALHAIKVEALRGLARAATNRVPIADPRG